MNIWQNKKWGPMLLEEINKPFNSKDYLFEIKFDGYRALIFASPKEVIVMSRNLKDITYLYPELLSLKSLVKKKVIFDGEIVSFVNGKPSFSKLQERSHLKNKLKIKEEALNAPITFMAFDILYEDKELTNLPLIKRKEYLEKYLDNEVFIKTKYINEDGKDLYKMVQKENLEGIIAKLQNSPYLINTRSNYWIKIKNYQYGTFWVIGYIEKETNYVITLLLGEKENKEFLLVGKVNMAKKNPLYKKIKKIRIIQKNKDENIIEPKLKCQVKYLERTKSNNLRQPVFVKERK